MKDPQVPQLRPNTGLKWIHTFVKKKKKKADVYISSSHRWMWEKAERQKIDAFKLWC